jgi:TPR repeat protein
MGVCLFHGDGVPAPQPVKALALWRAAAERGHARSMTAIGECYDNAEAELERDGTAACEWFVGDLLSIQLFIGISSVSLC